MGMHSVSSPLTREGLGIGLHGAASGSGDPLAAATACPAIPRRCCATGVLALFPGRGGEPARGASGGSGQHRGWATTSCSGPRPQPATPPDRPRHRFAVHGRLCSGGPHLSSLPACQLKQCASSALLRSQLKRQLHHDQLRRGEQCVRAARRGNLPASCHCSSVSSGWGPATIPATRTAPRQHTRPPPFLLSPPPPALPCPASVRACRAPWQVHLSTQCAALVPPACGCHGRPIEDQEEMLLCLMEMVVQAS